MKVKDFEEISCICSIYSMCYFLEECISSAEIPDKLKDCFDNLENSVRTAINCMVSYREETRNIFLSACEDYTIKQGDT